MWPQFSEDATRIFQSTEKGDDFILRLPFLSLPGRDLWSEGGQYSYRHNITLNYRAEKICFSSALLIWGQCHRQDRALFTEMAPCTQSMPVKDLVLLWSKVKLFLPPGYQGCSFAFKSVTITGPSPSTNTSTGQNLQSPTQNFGNSFKMYFKSNCRIPQKRWLCGSDAIPNLKKWISIYFLM